MEYIVNNQTEIISNIFYGSIILFLSLELFFPFRSNTGELTWSRWFSNIIIGGLNMVLVRFLLPASTIGFAALIAEKKFGLFNNIDVGIAAEIVLSFLILDLVGYYFHKLLHTYPVLWKFHLVHHSDLGFDVTTSVRHHPVESLISTALITATILLIGAPVISVIIYSVVRLFISIFSHANIRLPLIIDRALRFIVITPDFHRTHHSSDPAYTNSNYGNVISWWDYLFSTYRSKTNNEQKSMEIGLEYFRSDKDQILDRLLTQPFRPRH